MTGKKAGTATITATAGGKKATAKITVYGKPSLSVGATTIMDEHTTTAKLSNTNGTPTYSSSDKTIFTVNENGKIKGKKPGSATLTVKVKNKLNASVTLKATIKVRKIRLLTVGNSKTFRGNLNNAITTIASNRGFSITHTSITSGGYSLKQNYIKNTSSFTDKTYDIAVLQPQTDDELFYDYTLSDVKQIVTALKKKNSKIKIYLRKTWLVKNANTQKMSAIDSSANQKLYSEYRTSNARGGGAIKKYLPVFKKRYTSSSLIDGTIMHAANKVMNDVASATGVTVIRDGDLMYAAQKKGYPVFAYQAQSQYSSDVRHQSYLGGYTTAACIASKIFGIDPAKITTTANIHKKASDKKKYDDKTYGK